MKKVVGLVLFLVALMLTACSDPTAADLLLGSWKMERAYETVTSATQGTVVNDLPSADVRYIRFDEDGSCLIKEGNEKYHYYWYLSDETELLLVPTNSTTIQLNYTISELDKERLVYGNYYTQLDSASGARTIYTYTFEYKKL